MATSTARLYKNTEITREKNREIDNLSTYLARCSYITITGAQYFKHALHCTFKVDLPQNYTDDRTRDVNIDYVLITNSDSTKNYFYFVDDKKWLSANTVELTLTMDTINTFKGLYTLSKKSRILRCHKNRFKTITVNNTPVVVRDIDKTPEGLVSALFKDKENDCNILLNENNAVPGTPDFNCSDFYLIYASEKNVDVMDDNPINCYLVGNASKTWVLSHDIYGATLTYSELKTTMLNGWRADPPAGYEAVAYISSGGPITLDFYNGSNQVIGTVTLHVLNNNGGRLLKLYSDDLYGTNCYVTAHYVRPDGTIDQNGSIWDPTNLQDVPYLSSVAYCKLRNPNEVRTLKFYRMQQRVSSVSRLQDLSIVSTIRTTNTYLTTENNYSTGTMRSINRTLPNINKIVMIPYKPMENNFSTASNLPIVDTTKWHTDNFDNGEGFFSTPVLRYTGSPLENDKCIFTGCSSENMSSVDPLSPIDYRPTNIAYNNVRSMDNESKLFNSEFYQPKVVYDTYGQTFFLENVDAYDYYVGKPFTYTFIPSFQMVSGFLIKFPDYSFGLGTTDYTGTMMVERNNEISLYQNAFLNYMRTSYNWDQKAAKRQKEGIMRNFAQRGLSSMNTLFTQGTNAVGGYLTSNYDDMYSGALATVTEVGSLLVDAQSAIAQANQIDENMARKVDELQAQTTSVNGMSDVLLAKEYNKNKLKYVLYMPTPALRKMVYDFLHYFGYSTNIMDNPRVNTYLSSRYWFNFIQADVTFAATTNLSEEICNDIRQRYNEGLTIMHSHTINDRMEWDFDQEYENWETTLLHD